MKLKQRARTKLSAKRILIASAAFCFALAIGFILFINLSDKREARAASSGDYRTKASGNWNNVSTWERYNGSAWVSAMATPTSGDGVIEIRSGNYITINSDVTVDQFIIDDGGMLTNSGGTFTIADGAGIDISINGFWSINSSVRINNGATGTLAGYAFCQSGCIMTIGSGASVTISNYGIFERDGGTVTESSGRWIVNNGGSYRHNMDGDSLPLASWAAGSNCEITGAVFAAPSNLNQSFSNFAWSCASQAGKLNFNNALKTVNGDFRMTSTGTGSTKFSSSANNESLFIGGNYYQDGGNVIVTESSNWNITVAGSFNMTDGNLIMTDGTAAGDGNPSLVVRGNTLITGGTIDMSQYSGSVYGKGIGTIRLNGDLNRSGGDILSSSTGTGNGIFIFSKNGIQAFNVTTPFGNKVDISVNNGSTLNLGMTIISGGRNFTVAIGGGLILGDADGITSSEAAGNIQMPGTRTFSAGSNYTYCSTVPQVTGNGIPSTVNNLTVINPDGLTLSKSVVVTHCVTMTSGNIHTLLDTLGLGVNNSNIGTMVRTDATITGWFKRWISASASSGYLFPVSYNGNYRAVSLDYTNAPSTGGYITVHYTPEDPGAAGLPLNDAGAVIADVGHEGYWNVTAESRVANGKWNIDINAENYYGLTDYTKLHIVQRVDDTRKWTLVGNHSNSTGSRTNPVSHRSSINGSAYGEFAIAGGTFNALPIELISFNAKPAGSIVKLTWTTANEINNDYFTVERSNDTVNFTTLTKVDGAGNSSSMLYYNSTDEKPFSGVNYYRLKLTDYDGNSTYSEIKMVLFDKSHSDDAVLIESVYPNPFMDNFTLNYTTLTDGEVHLVLLNMAGEVFKKETLMAVKGLNTYQFVENINLAVGVYYVRLTMNDKVVVKKIIKNS